MPLDAICLTALIKELTPALTGARIDKVQQPERDLLLLSLYQRGENRRLLISANVGASRLHFTGSRPENPSAPPMFCMLLRKHLLGGRIVSVAQPKWERLALIGISCRDELGVTEEKTLAVELMGRASNVILTGADGRIIDCLRRADFGEEAERRLLPGMIYRLPSGQRRPNFFALSPEERSALYLASAAETEPDKRLMDAFSGLSPLIAREMAYRGGADLIPAMEAMCESVAAGELTPTMLLGEGGPMDFSFMSINQYGDKVKNETYPDFSSLLDAFYLRRDKAERMRRLSADTVKTVRTLRDRQARKLVQQKTELASAGDREEGRRHAELLTANLWRTRKGEQSLVCEDYYAPGSPEVEIRLDPLKTPQQNAAAMYKDYRKKAAAEKHLTELIAAGEARLDYLESVLDELSRCESEADMAEIRAELAENGGLKNRPRAGREKKPRPRAPLAFRSTAGLEILVGRSNAQNDELTSKIAGKTDLWLHVQKLHGAHVILRTGRGEADRQSLLEAASLAVFYSQGREAGRAPVDYTQVRYVKKPAGSMPGKVVYTDYGTVVASCDGELTERLKA